MFRLRLSFAFAVLVALVCCQAAFVYWGSNRVNEYAAHSRLTSDILSELLEISANKQRLRVWSSQRLMNAEATSGVRDQLLERMRAGAARLDAMSRLHLDSWRKVSAREEIVVPQEAFQLVEISKLLDGNILEVQAQLQDLQPLSPGAEFPNVWRQVAQVFDMTQGRDLRELLNGAIEGQRKAVPIARAATERGLDRLRQQAIAMAIIALVAAVLWTLHLRGRLKRPLELLMQGTRALQSGSLEHRIELASGDEFEVVARHFNQMAAELQQHRQEADEARRRLEDAVQDRTQELQSAHDTLQLLDHRRRQLFVDLSHELRTPATAIRGEAEITLRGGDKPAEEYRQALKRIVGTVQQLTHVIGDLLLIARAEADQLVIQPSPMDLSMLLSEAAEQGEALAALHGVALAYEPAAEMVMVRADGDRLRQAVMIVLDNAIRYSRVNGKVHLGCKVAGEEVSIVVRDHGIGIDPDELPRVFERFVRGHRARAHRADGSGIGLSIAQAIVKAHRGHIDIRSAPEEGTEVRVVLARLPIHEPEASVLQP